MTGGPGPPQPNEPHSLRYHERSAPRAAVMFGRTRRPHRVWWDDLTGVARVETPVTHPPTNPGIAVGAAPCLRLGPYTRRCSESRRWFTGSAAGPDPAVHARVNAQPRGHIHYRNWRTWPEKVHDRKNKMPRSKGAMHPIDEGKPPGRSRAQNVRFLFVVDSRSPPATNACTRVMVLPCRVGEILPGRSAGGLTVSLNQTLSKPTQIAWEAK